MGKGSCKPIPGNPEFRKLMSSARWERATLAAIENTNNLYFNGNVEVNLVKYSSQVVTSNNYHGQYDSRALGNVGVLNEAYSPSVEETLKNRDPQYKFLPLTGNLSSKNPQFSRSGA